MPIILLMTNSKRAKPTPSLGVWANVNAISGLPTFIMILTGGDGRTVSFSVLTSYSRAPWNTSPVSPSEQQTVTISPSCKSSVAFTLPTIAGIPSSRAMMAA